MHHRTEPLAQEMRRMVLLLEKTTSPSGKVRKAWGSRVCASANGLCRARGQEGGRVETKTRVLVAAEHVHTPRAWVAQV